MKDPLGFEIGGKARSIEALISPLNSHEQGGGSASSAQETPKIINIGKVGAQQVQIPDRNGGPISHTYFAYEVDRPIKAQGEYEVLISKVQRVM